MHSSGARRRPLLLGPWAALGGILLALLTVVGGGCFYSRRYHPSPGYEQILYARAHRNVSPADVRITLERYRQDMVMWTGVVTTVERLGGSGNLRVTVDHRYWNEMEYWSPDGVYVRLWPEGEGQFACNFVPQYGVPAGRVAQVNDMVIAYGWPRGVTPDGTVIMECPFLRTHGPGHYETEAGPTLVVEAGG